MAQNGDRAATPLTMPVLAIGGEDKLGRRRRRRHVGIAKDVQTVVIPGGSHWVAEEAPEELLAALTAFLAPSGAARAQRRRLTMPTRQGHRRSAGRPGGSTPSHSAPPSCAATSSW